MPKKSIETRDDYDRVSVVLECCDDRNSGDYFYYYMKTSSGRWVFVQSWPGAGHRSRGCGERTPNPEHRTRRAAAAPA